MRFVAFLTLILDPVHQQSTAVKRRLLIHILFNIVIILDKLECRQPDSETNTFRKLEAVEGKRKETFK